MVVMRKGSVTMDDGFFARLYGGELDKEELTCEVSRLVWMRIISCRRTAAERHARTMNNP